MQWPTHLLLLLLFILSCSLYHKLWVFAVKNIPLLSIIGLVYTHTKSNCSHSFCYWYGYIRYCIQRLYWYWVTLMYTTILQISINILTPNFTYIWTIYVLLYTSSAKIKNAWKRFLFLPSVCEKNICVNF